MNCVRAALSIRAVDLEFTFQETAQEERKGLEDRLKREFASALSIEERAELKKVREQIKRIKRILPAQNRYWPQALLPIVVAR